MPRVRSGVTLGLDKDTSRFGGTVMGQAVGGLGAAISCLVGVVQGHLGDMW